MGNNTNIIEAELSTSIKNNKGQNKNETANGPFDKNDGDVEMAKVEDS